MHKLLFNAVEVAASGNSTSAEVGLYDGLSTHAFQYKITGDGTLKFEFYVQVGDSGDWILDSTYTGYTKTSGPGSDGKGIIALSLSASDMMKVVATETGGADSATLSGWFAQK